MSSLRVALTFDAEHPDRPHHLVGSEDQLRETLGSLNVHGTFFVQGRWAEAFPDQARRIADDGHLIGNHSHYHAKMHLLTEAGLMEDIKTAAGAIETICKRDPAPRLPAGALERFG
jgi:peptidoglycan-N-acetylglucosamine deacetylase